MQQKPGLAVSQSAQVIARTPSRNNLRAAYSMKKRELLRSKNQMSSQEDRFNKSPSLMAKGIKVASKESNLAENGTPKVTAALTNMLRAKDKKPGFKSNKIKVTHK